MPERNRRLYNIWACMKQRCNNPKHTAAEWYHHRGIRVCPERNNSFLVFPFENGYSDNLTIDRIDPDGNYEPNNCRWIPMRENLRRARKTEGRALYKKQRGLRNGNFMVARKPKSPRFSDWYEVIETGFTKAQARARANELQSGDRSQPHEYRVFATDGHKVGETVALSELRYYLTKRI